MTSTAFVSLPHPVPLTGPGGTPLLELTACTLLWLDEHYPKQFTIFFCMRGNPPYDAIGPLNGSLANVQQHGAYCFKPGQIINDCFILATDPDYFEKLDKYVKMWLEKNCQLIEDEHV